MYSRPECEWGAPPSQSDHWPSVNRSPKRGTMSQQQPPTALHPSPAPSLPACPAKKLPWRSVEVWFIKYEFPVIWLRIVYTWTKFWLGKMLFFLHDVLENLLMKGTGSPLTLICNLSFMSNRLCPIITCCCHICSEQFNTWCTVYWHSEAQEYSAL